MVGLTAPLFVVTECGEHSLFSVKKQQVGIPAEQFRNQRNRPIATREIHTNDPVVCDMANPIDARALNTCPQQLTEGGRSRWIGEGPMDKVQPCRLVACGTE